MEIHKEPFVSSGLQNHHHRLLFTPSPYNSLHHHCSVYSLYPKPPAAAELSDSPLFVIAVFISGYTVMILWVPYVVYASVMNHWTLLIMTSSSHSYHSQHLISNTFLNSSSSVVREILMLHLHTSQMILMETIMLPLTPRKLNKRPVLQCHVTSVTFCCVGRHLQSHRGWLSWSWPDLVEKDRIVLVSG